MSIKLSILVPTVPNRIDNYYLRIMTDLIQQVAPYPDIELIAFFDNKKRTIGKKRDDMLGLAKGNISSLSTTTIDSPPTMSKI